MMGEAITQFLWRLLLEVRTYVKRTQKTGKAHGAERKAKEDYGLLTTGQRTLERQLSVGSEQQENGLLTTGLQPEEIIRRFTGKLLLAQRRQARQVLRVGSGLDNLIIFRNQSR